jgi:hypothetical protein
MIDRTSSKVIDPHRYLGTKRWKVLTEYHFDNFKFSMLLEPNPEEINQCESTFETLLSLVLIY